MVQHKDIAESQRHPPAAHESSHISGSDQLPLANNGAKGLLKQLDNVPTHYMDGAGNWTAPASSGCMLKSTYDPNDDGIIAVAQTEATKYPDTGEQAFLDADHTKLNGIETGADVTDATNVTAAGAIMDGDFTADEGFMKKNSAGSYEAVKSNLAAVAAPTVNDDNGDGYVVGSRWLYGNKEYVCVDMSIGAAVWIETTSQGDTRYIQVMIFDPASDVVTGTKKVFVHLPFAGTLTGVHAEIDTASTSGLPTVDINKNGSTVLSTKLTIDANETGSDTAATPVVISVSAIAANDVYTFDVDGAGTGTKGLTVTCTVVVT